jgi:hypothetical protein
MGNSAGAIGLQRVSSAFLFRNGEDLLRKALVEEEACGSRVGVCIAASVASHVSRGRTFGECDAMKMLVSSHVGYDIERRRKR